MALGLLLLLSTAAAGQQPQTSAATNGANSSYVQGVGPGYWPTAGSGLTLNLTAGSAFCNRAAVTYAGGTLTMTASTTNYVFLDDTNSCVPASNTSGFTETTIPVAIVATGSSSITTITDMRIWGFSGARLTTGRVLADHFSGADPCVQIAAAAASTPTPSVVDARAFTGSVNCSVNPLSTATTGITYLLGNAVYLASVPWVISATQTSIIGSAPFASGSAGGGTAIKATGSGWLAPATIAASPSGATESASTVTITTTASHGFSVGQHVVIFGVARSGYNVAGYNGTFTITSVPLSTQFRYTDSITGLQPAGGGTPTVGWIVDDSNPNNSGGCASGGCAGIQIQNLMLNGNALAPNGLLLATSSFDLADASLSNLRIYDLNGGVGLEMGSSINDVTLTGVDIESGGSIGGSMGVGVDLPAATIAKYYNLTVAGATGAGMNLGSAGGATVYGGVFSGNGVDLLVTNNTAQVSFFGSWFENSGNGIVKNTSAYPYAAGISFHGCRLHSSSATSIFDFTNVNGWVEIDGGSFDPAGQQRYMPGVTSALNLRISSLANVGSLSVGSSTCSNCNLPSNASVYQTGSVGGPGPASAGVVRKTGSQTVNYKTTLTTFTDVDAANLFDTTVVPVGWKLYVVASFICFQSTAAAGMQFQIYDTRGGGQPGVAYIIPGGTSQPQSATVQAVITGDGASHTVKLQFATLNASDAANIQNTSASYTPVMTFTLMPSP